MRNGLVDARIFSARFARLFISTSVTEWGNKEQRIPFFVTARRYQVTLTSPGDDPQPLWDDRRPIERRHLASTARAASPNYILL